MNIQDTIKGFAGAIKRDEGLCLTYEAAIATEFKSLKGKYAEPLSDDLVDDWAHEAARNFLALFAGAALTSIDHDPGTNLVGQGLEPDDNLPSQEGQQQKKKSKK